jgi:hypothetical protein
MAIPLLHILLGICNKTFSELVKSVPEANEWPKKLSLRRENYHGNVFEGNECSKLLKNTFILEDILINSKKYDAGKHFLFVFNSFKEVLNSLHESLVDVNCLKRKIEDFKIAWKGSGMSVTTKVHIVFEHLVDFVILKECKNIGRFCEQSHESAHAEFDKTWRKYIVKEISNKHFKDRLLKSVIDYNSSHAI